MTLTRRKDAPLDPFKRAVTLTTRSIAADSAVEVVFSNEPPGLAGKTARLPEPSRVPTKTEIAVHESRPRQIGDAHHMRDLLAFDVRFGERLDLRQHDPGLVVMRQIVQRRDDRPAVHLTLIDLLRTVIKAGRIAEPDGVRGREQAERRMRANDLRLIKQRQLARDFEHALNNEHYVGPTCIVLIEAQSGIALQRPR